MDVDFFGQVSEVFYYAQKATQLLHSLIKSYNLWSLDVWGSEWRGAQWIPGLCSWRLPCFLSSMFLAMLRFLFLLLCRSDVLVLLYSLLIFFLRGAYWNFRSQESCSGEDAWRHKWKRPYLDWVPFSACPKYWKRSFGSYMDCIEEIGYDNDIKLRDDLIAMPIKRAPDQV